MERLDTPGKRLKQVPNHETNACYHCGFSRSGINMFQNMKHVSVAGEEWEGWGWDWDWGYLRSGGLLADGTRLLAQSTELLADNILLLAVGVRLLAFGGLTCGWAPFTCDHRTTSPNKKGCTLCFFIMHSLYLHTRFQGWLVFCGHLFNIFIGNQFNYTNHRNSRCHINSVISDIIRKHVEINMAHILYRIIICRRN